MEQNTQHPGQMVHVPVFVSLLLMNNGNKNNTAKDKQKISLTPLRPSRSGKNTGVRKQLSEILSELMILVST